MAWSWVEGLLLHWCISWLRLNVCWWLVLWVDHLVLRLACSHSDRRLAIRGSLHWLGDWVSAWWCGLNSWSLCNGRGWNELLALRNCTKLLLGVVSNVLLILSLLFSQLSVDLLPELVHELSHPSLNFLIDEVANTLAHICWNLVQIILISLLFLWAHILFHWRNHFLLLSSLHDWLPLVCWLVARLDWWSSALILDLFAVIWHLMVNQDVLSDQWHVVVNEVVPVVVLLVVAHKLFSLVHLYELWSIRLSTSLVASVWLRVNTLERSWLNLENILTTGHDHIINLHFWTDYNTVLVVKMRVTHHEYLGVSVVLNELEVVACLPIVLFLVNENVFEVLLCHLDHTGLVLHVMLYVGHREVVQYFNLVELFGQVLGELDFADTIAVYAEG